MELILLFVIYVIVMALKDASTPRRNAFDVGAYCEYAREYGEEAADRQRKNGMFDL